MSWPWPASLPSYPNSLGPCHAAFSYSSFGTWSNERPLSGTPRPSPVPPELRAFDARDYKPLSRRNTNLPFAFPQVQYSSWRGSNPASSSSSSSFQLDLPEQFLSWDELHPPPSSSFPFLAEEFSFLQCRIHYHHRIFPSPQSISLVKRTDPFFVHPDSKLLTDSQTHFSLRSIYQFSVHLLV